MDKTTRNSIQRATQKARKLLEDAYREQLEGTFDILLDGTVAQHPGTHLSPAQRVTREKLVATIAHKRSTGLQAREAVDAYLREAAFTTLNRFVALKMLEARDLVQECVSKGEDSSGFKEFAALAPGLVALGESAYQLYLQSLFDEIGQEVKVLFDRRDVASLVWPDRHAMLELLRVLNAPELLNVWAEDETIGWVYQYFNGDEERTLMRAESQVPRSSRELAVRNQFFTPRYVVRFLTDNTLGRTWYEMMQGETTLAHLEYLTSSPNEVFLSDGESAPAAVAQDSGLSQDDAAPEAAHVPFRAKKDPRDLRILDPACGSGHFLLYAFDLLVRIYEEAWSDEGAAPSVRTGGELRSDYGSSQDLRRAMPELILRHNLYGVDIDARAAQIAAFALWMRAQRAFNEFSVDRAHRHPITKTNVVVAEPMPGDSRLADEFAARLKPAVLGDLFNRMVREMRLAGDLGSLLKIEKSIAKAVRDAAEASQQGNLFDRTIESHEFWDTADEEIIAALHSFAESAAGTGGLRRRLFAGDAAQGVAFIELARKQFDVVLMNPPFGGFTQRAQKYVDQEHVAGRNDIYAAMVLRGRSLLCSSGLLGAITSRAFIIGRGLRRFREALLLPGSFGPRLMVDLGAGVLDGALVETAAYVLGRGASQLQVAVLDDDASRLAFSRAGVSCAEWRGFDHEHFRKLPMTQFIYSLSAGAAKSIMAPDRTFQPSIGRVTKGLSSGDNFRFLRLRWEVPTDAFDSRWQLCAKGGEYAWFSGDLHLVVNREQDGYEMAVRAEETDGNPARTRQSSAYYGRPAATWSCRSQKGFSMRRLRRGTCFLHKSGVVLPDAVPEKWIPTLIAVFASTTYQELVAAQSRFGAYETGAIGRLPAPDETLCEGFDAWQAPIECSDNIDRHDETSLVFNVPPPVDWQPAKEMGHALDRLDLGLRQHELTLDPEVRRNEIARARARAEALEPYHAWLSFALGVAFGRWQELGNGQAGSPTGPLDGIAPGPMAEDAARRLLTDDVGAATDIIATVARVGARLATAHDIPGEWFQRSPKLRSYFAKRFFGLHKRAYSRSQRSAPVYWQLGTASASFSVWCCYHGLTKDTFYRIATGHVAPKLGHEESKLNALRQEAGVDPSSKQRKALDLQEGFVAELRGFQSEVERVAPLWNPNLNDGVVINCAPLWRLVPQNKSWQKECMKVWDKLCEGEYDWAHLAMHLWPERVVPKCAKHRNLAVAHGLEETLWYETEAGDWKARSIDREQLDQLIAARSSSAVKAALESLLTAPAPTGTSKRRGRKRGGA